MMKPVNFLRRGLVLAALALSVAPAAAQERTAPEPGKTYRVGYAQLVDHPALNATREGVIEALKEAGFEEGKNLVFDYQNAQGNPGAARNIIDKFVADGDDVIAPCTTPLAQAAIKLTQGSSVPVAFGCVTNPVQTGILAATDKATGTNVTGFYTMPPVKRNIEMFLEIQPQMKRVGAIWNSGESNSEAMVKLAQAEIEARGMSWVPVAITSSAEVKNAAESLVGKVDAIVTPQDNTVASAYQALEKVVRDNQIPWFTFDSQAVEQGAIAAMSQDQIQAGREWARQVIVPVLLGKPAGELVPVEGNVYETRVNLAAAKAAGLTVPQDIVGRASRVFK